MDHHRDHAAGSNGLPDRRHGLAGAALAWLRRRLRLRPADSLWQSLAQAFGQRDEQTFHPPPYGDGFASELHAIDPGSTELEVLQLLHALVCLAKPERVLETGTFRGFGAIALSHALVMNGKGRLVTIDRDPEAIRLARRHLRCFDARLLDRVDLVEADALAFLREYAGPPFGAIFIDTVMSQRVAELELLLDRGLLEPGGFCVLHDTSIPALPMQGPSHTWQGLDRLETIVSSHHGFRFDRSRGFVLIQATPRLP